ncbi:MAG: YeeE/YedE thiosulfate transporter family protein [Betaproteobacteria bacterium]
MTVLSAVIIGVVMGILFGIALEKSRVFEPGMIVGQMQMRNFTMLKVFLTAVVTGLVVIAVMHGFFGSKLYPKTLLYSADIIGGLILGAGITLAGACPGTVFAQIGAGYKDSWLILIGGLAGALTFSYVEPVLKPVLLSGGPGKLTLDTMLGMPFWIVACAFAMALVALLVALEKWRPWQGDLGKDFDGVKS